MKIYISSITFFLSLLLITALSAENDKQEELDDKFVEACFDDKPEEVQKLISMGANVNYKDSISVIYACRNNNYELFNLLIANGADIHNIKNSLFLGVNDNDFMLAMINAGIPYNLPDARGFYAIHYQVTGTNVENIKLLIDLGCSVNTPSENHNITPLTVVVSKSGTKSEILDLLLTSGANPNMADTSGATPLHIAALRGEIDIMRKLVEAGADINAQTNDGLSVLFYAFFNIKGTKAYEYILYKIREKSYSPIIQQRFL